MEKKGRLVPKRRFKEFQNAGDWEQRRLGEVVQIIMGQSPDGSTYSDTPAKYILVQGNADLENGWVKPRVWTTQVTKTANAGDLIMSVRAPAGAVGKTAFSVVIGRGVAAIKGNDFIYQLLIKMNEDEFWKILSSGSTFDSLNTDNINKAEIKVPDFMEQGEIGKLFDNLDHLITLHQRKLDKTKAMKKAYLSEMFPADGETKPKLRFKGFTEDWEQRRLDDICIYQSSILTVGDAHEKGKYPLYDANTMIGFTDVVIENEEYITIIKDGSGVGKVRKLPKNTSFIGTMGSIKTKKSSLDFLYAILKRLDFTQYIIGAAIPHIYFSDYGKINIQIPKMDEQNKIGEVFRILDNAITLHQRKLEKLKNIKKAYLNEMFV